MHGQDRDTRVTVKRCLAILLLLVFMLPNMGLAGGMPNAFSFEILGNAGLYSFNYERNIFSFRLRSHFFGRTGISFLPFYYENYRAVLVVPTQLSYLASFGRNGLELAAGATFRVLFNTAWHAADKQISPALSINYRYTVPGSGSYFKVGFTPLFFDGLSPWFGITMGRSF